jgi:hypothetical protein
MSKTGSDLGLVLPDRSVGQRRPKPGDSFVSNLASFVYVTLDRGKTPSAQKNPMGGFLIDGPDCLADTGCRLPAFRMPTNERSAEVSQF